MLRIIAVRREFFARRIAVLPDAVGINKLIDRERARMFRTGAEFSLILFRAKRTGNVRSTYRLAKVVLTRARSSDVLGWFDDDHLCLVLPDTESSGAWRVANDICTLLAGKKMLRPLFAVYTAERTGFKGGAIVGPVGLTHVHDGGDNGNGNGNGNGGGDHRHAVEAHALHAERGRRTDMGNSSANGNGNEKENDNDNGNDDNGHDGNGHGGNGHEGASDVQGGPDGEGRDVGALPTFRATELLPRLLMKMREPIDANQPVQRIEELLVRTLPPWKRGIDVCGAGLGLLLASPLLLVIAAAIKLTSKGPILFYQKRAGLGGVPFLIYKFRTMVMHAERNKQELRRQSEQDGPAFKLRADPRVTPLGRMLRATSFDELPQLWNVLMGDMSLVGPRPLPLEESDACETWHRARLDVTPGITGVWQVRGRSRVSFAEWMRMDIGYIRRRGFWTDLRILVATVPAVVLRRGAH